MSQSRSAEANSFFDLLRKRHACRHFEQRPVPDEFLDLLAYAVHKAPTAGNESHRFAVVVKDLLQLRMLKLISPGFFGDAPAAVVICTDTRVIKRSGSTGLLQECLYDAGAAAENVLLAAYSLGLAGTLVKSYSEAALSRILELAEGCRTELVVSVGYPSKDEPPPVKKKPGGKITYLDKYGQPWTAGHARVS